MDARLGERQSPAYEPVDESSANLGAAPAQMRVELAQVAGRADQARISAGAPMGAASAARGAAPALIEALSGPKRRIACGTATTFAAFGMTSLGWTRTIGKSLLVNCRCDPRS
jgi:hypothetical protein